MDPHVYDGLVKQEKTHWWFISRRAVAYTMLRGTTLPKSPLILDAGCGSGGNLPMLASLGDVFAMDKDERMLAVARKRKIGKVEACNLPGPIPFGDLNFDLVALFDVLEHVEDDRAALETLASRMNPSAVMCITVPSYPWLFSRIDRQHHHFRRYSKKQLKTLLIETGYEVQWMNYWNCLLFPFALVVRLLEKLPSNTDYTIGTRQPPPWLNTLLKKILVAERTLIPITPLPFGLSMIVIARKR